MRSFEKEIAGTQQWFDSTIFAGSVRLYTACQVVEQCGTIASDYTVAGRPLYDPANPKRVVLMPLVAMPLVAIDLSATTS
jgi:hypothetical protein